MGGRGKGGWASASKHPLITQLPKVTTKDFGLGNHTKSAFASANELDPDVLRIVIFKNYESRFEKFMAQLMTY